MMRRLVVVLLLLAILLSQETISAAETSGDGDRCSRRCGGTIVPYPFGFSPGCPILLTCDATTSTTILPYKGDNGTTYRVIAYNSSASTVVVSLPPSCNRTVPEARRALYGGNYAVSSHTGMFLRGGCSNSSTSNGSVCSVPEAVMSRLLRRAQCDVNGTTATSGSAVACVSSPAANDNGTAARDLFLPWDNVEKPKCDDVLTSTVIMYTPQGATSLEFGVAELGWWLNGTCAGGLERCAANATCSDVHTLSGAVGHRCTCLAGMDGDSFAAGDRCYLKSQGWIGILYQARPKMTMIM